MTNKYNSARLVMVLLLLTAGCAGEDSSWRLDMGGHDEEVENGYRFTGDVGLGGHYSGVTVEDVHVRILDAQNRTLETVAVGTLNESRSMAKINVTVERRPKYVLVLVGEVVAPERENENPDVSGLERVEGGDYYSYTHYDPYALSNKTNN